MAAGERLVGNGQDSDALAWIARRSGELIALMVASSDGEVGAELDELEVLEAARLAITTGDVMALDDPAGFEDTVEDFANREQRARDDEQAALEQA